jgi:uncharacterized membrane protein YbhN (UPF0104 family)
LLAPDRTLSELATPALDLRALARRAGIPVLLAGMALAGVLLAGGRVHALTDGLRRGLGVGAGWGALGAVFECASLVGYVGLLSLVAGGAAPRVGKRESAQITLAGAAATRVLPTAGAGGVALTLWALRRAGLRPRAATRTLLVFLVLLYSVFLASIVVAGAALALGLVPSQGPLEFSAIPTAAAALAFTACLAFARRPSAVHDASAREGSVKFRRRERLHAAASLVGEAVRDALRVLRGGDPRLAGALVYWALDAAVLWAMLHAFGSPPVLAVVALAYLIGQVANTIPLPGSVSGGMAGVLIAFGVPPELALPSVLAYRAIAVWLPVPLAIAAVPALRATVARWAVEDAAGTTRDRSPATCAAVARTRRRGYHLAPRAPVFHSRRRSLELC